MIKVLNLYAGIGGNRKKWENVEVTAVELNTEIAEIYREQHPGDTLIIGDAHEYLLKHYKEFDFIWSSPPCQTHSRMNKATRHDTVRYADMTLYQEILLLKNFYKGKHVVENVIPYYEPLIKGQQMSRHIFWSNFFIPQFDLKSPENFSKLGGNEGKKKMMDWLGIHFEKNIYYGDNHDQAQILRNCVHPDLGLHVFNASLKNEHATLFNQ